MDGHAAVRARVEREFTYADHGTFTYADYGTPWSVVTRNLDVIVSYCVMSSKHIRTDANFAWPTAEIAVMGAALSALDTKRDRNPPKKHGNIPL